MPTHTESALGGALVSLFSRHAGLLGIEGAALSVRSARYAATLDMWYVDVDVLREGLPTYRGGLSARVKQGRLILVHASTAPAAPVVGAQRVTSQAAIAAAIAQGSAPAAQHTEAAAELILLDDKSSSGHVLRRTWKVRTRTASPPGIWVAFVDAASGEVLHVHNEVRFITGAVHAEHHERTVDGTPLVTSPLPLVSVSSTADSAITDTLGSYTVTDGAPYETDLLGDYLAVFNDAGGEGVLSSNDADMTWTDGDATQAELDTYVFVHQVKAWGEVYAPDVSMVTDPQTATVNINASCNAFWNGELNFFAAGGGCNNTGQIADVVYHEWGHGFHWASLRAGRFDGSLSEGAGDIVSFLQTGDNVLAPWFGDTGWGIRDVAPDRVYPDDFTNNDVHSNGLIFGGSFWDLLGLLQDLEGEEQGLRSTSQIFAGTLKGGPDIPGSVYEALAADDDDSNLANGTPHACQIYEAFSRHGLGPSADDPLVFADHEPLVRVPAGSDHAVRVEFTEVQDGCQDGDADWGEVHWRIAGGEWQTTELSAAGSLVTGAIPEQPAGTFVDYYVVSGAADGTTFSSPAGQFINPHTFIVGDVLQLDCEDFEANDAGYTHELVSGEMGDGADDWQWGPPNGQSGDPASAFSGGSSWGNDLGNEGFNGAYQSDKVNRLSSGTIGTGHYTDVYLAYRRWLQVEDASSDLATVLANDTVVWTNRIGTGDEHHQDGQWVSHAVDLGGIADQGEVAFRWELSSNGDAEFGGWNIDDVCVMAPATPDNRLGIVDFDASPVGDVEMALSWTHPVHAPLERVVVTRRFDRFPEAWNDGTIVIDASDPVVGERIETLDLNFNEGASFYAVYGFDGVAWLSWTIEGWNADTDVLVGGDPPPGWVGTDVPPPGVEGEGQRLGGCGCAGAGSSGGWLVVGAALLLVRRRQRGT